MHFNTTRAFCLNANDPFEDTETLTTLVALVTLVSVSMPTIRSRILKRTEVKINLIPIIGLNANDPFEDTETRAIPSRPVANVDSLNANDPFEDTETLLLALEQTKWHCVSMPTIRSRILKLPVAAGVLDVYPESQCQRSVRGY